jgi:hypothetical protein
VAARLTAEQRREALRLARLLAEGLIHANNTGAVPAPRSYLALEEMAEALLRVLASRKVVIPPRTPT